MIDTHSHIKPLSASPNLPLTRQRRAGKGELSFVVLSGSNLEDSKNNIELAKKNSKLKASVGIHPQETINEQRATINELEELLIENKNIVAVGECGLDYSLVESQKSESLKVKENMENVFRLQIELAQKYNKALIVHSRKAMDETIEILKKYKNLRGVIHCYTGGVKRIKILQSRINNNDFYFGIDGNLTYEDGLVEVVKNIPKDRLVLETDSPELTPVPHRGEQNCPEYVKYVYQKVAEIWGMSFEETEKIIDENAKRLFGI